ncbi:uncharacterized protein LOC108740070 [Agrilus planipennis]|uniref:Uncharacterized protein LOC108740070 n=1 Tax=Agrilus planipennis TaxID=224129 RepID=A0A1W4XBG0_AGRPL|nr:uncharacterized protein LOC108740070 [Agrilus planipennis]
MNSRIHHWNSRQRRKERRLARLVAQLQASTPIPVSGEPSHLDQYLQHQRFLRSSPSKEEIVIAQSAAGSATASPLDRSDWLVFLILSLQIISLLWTAYREYQRHI